MQSRAFLVSGQRNIAFRRQRKAQARPRQALRSRMEELYAEVPHGRVHRRTGIDRQGKPLQPIMATTNGSGPDMASSR